VARLQALHPVALLVGDHRLDVDHPHLDLLAEDARRRLRRRLLGRPRRQRGEQGHSGQPPCALRFHGKLSVKGRKDGTPWSPPRQFLLSTTSRSGGFFLTLTGPCRQGCRRSQEGAPGSAGILAGRGPVRPYGFTFSSAQERLSLRPSLTAKTSLCGILRSFRVVS